MNFEEESVGLSQSLPAKQQSPRKPDQKKNIESVKEEEKEESDQQ